MSDETESTPLSAEYAAYGTLIRDLVGTDPQGPVPPDLVGVLDGIGDAGIRDIYATLPDGVRSRLLADQSVRRRVVGAFQPSLGERPAPSDKAPSGRLADPEMAPAFTAGAILLLLACLVALVAVALGLSWPLVLVVFLAFLVGGLLRWMSDHPGQLLRLP